MRVSHADSLSGVEASVNYVVAPLCLTGRSGDCGDGKTLSQGSDSSLCSRIFRHPASCPSAMQLQTGMQSGTQSR